MKFHALALCLAAALAAGTTAFAEDTSKPHHDTAGSISRDATEKDRYTGYSVYAGERLYYREILFPELQSLDDVARKLSEIIEKQRHEQAMLQSLAPRAQTAGFTNVSSVYEHMASDHDRLADFASNWLRERNYPTPPETVTVAVADMSPEASIDHVTAMHEKAFNEALDKRQNEQSSTVRGTLLWAAATTARHISLLRTLDRDVEFGRKTLSARLQSMMDGTYTASGQTDLMARIYEEETEIINRLNTTTTATAQAPPVQVVEVERIVERPVERIVERVVEKPVIVDRVVEKPVVVERIVERKVYVNQRVAGSRSRTRRPAK